MMKLGENLWLVQTDSRGRVTLPMLQPGRRYRVTEDDDGTIILEPVPVRDALREAFDRIEREDADGLDLLSR